MKKLFLLALAITCVSLQGLITTQSVEAANAANWTAGRIIDDHIFTNEGTMSASSVQAFLNGKGSGCLKDFQTPEPLGNNQYGADVSSARAIWKAGQLFDINPQVLLVTLQKEQGLITVDGNC